MERKIRVNGGSLQTSIPADIVHAFGLHHGDASIWALEGGLVTVKFFKRTLVEKTQEMPLGDAVDAATAA